MREIPFLPGIARMALLAVLVLFIVFVMATMSGCGTTHLAGVQNHGKVQPKAWVRADFTRDQMIADSLDCEDTAKAADGNYDSYLSTSGYTPKQITVYNDCMQRKGYTEVKK